jgi:hypothetical protein
VRIAFGHKGKRMRLEYGNPAAAVIARAINSAISAERP